MKRYCHLAAFYLCLVAGCAVLAAVCDPQGKLAAPWMVDWNKASGPYHPVHFPESMMRPPSERTTTYSDWAAFVANEVVEQLGQKKTLTDILKHVAERRAELADEMGEPKSLRYGVRRLPPHSMRYLLPGRSEIGYLKNESRPLNQQLVARVLSRHPEATSFPEGAYRKLSHNQYQPMEGRPFELTPMVVHEGMIKAEHPYEMTAAEVMKDVLKRLTWVLDHPTAPPEKRMEEFVQAMYGYYNAVPFYRGSSAIGRVFLAGIYRAAFGKPIPALPDAVDVLAMLSSQEAFLKEIAPQLR